MGSQFRAAPTAGGDAPDVDRRIDHADNSLSPEQGIEALYRRHHTRLLRFFTRRTLVADAQDLVHDTFTRYADRTLIAADAVLEPDAYLSQAAANLLRDRAKFAVRRAAAYHHVFEDENVAGIDPVAGLEARDLLQRLEAAVQRLKPRRREVFLMQRVDGLSYAEIAETTGMSIRTVKKQMAKALFDLRRDFGPL